MTLKWTDIKKVLCVRLDNMGDVLMSEPAMRALKHSFSCEITLLTSSAGSKIASQLKCVDDVIVYNVPWMKTENTIHEQHFFETALKLKNENFDAAVIFSVFSQNPLPAAMLLWLAQIPKRLAYCRENPYTLLTDWIPEKEPYNFIRHQVKRDLDLVESAGAFTDDDSIHLNIQHDTAQTINKILYENNVDAHRPFVVLHPGVSEKKRMYPLNNWVEIGKKLRSQNVQIVVSGVSKEFTIAETIASQCGGTSLAGKLSTEEFSQLIANASLVISVNTSTIHIAAATATPVIALYALTNPQHTPWKGIGYVMPFSVEPDLQSRNEILRYVNEIFFDEPVAIPTPSQVISNVKKILIQKIRPVIPEMITSQHIDWRLGHFTETVES
jgi:lipopolysaccharide heptosyltransferase II